MPVLSHLGVKLRIVNPFVAYPTTKGAGHESTKPAYRNLAINGLFSFV